jgi:hypothetical protein
MDTNEEGGEMGETVAAQAAVAARSADEKLSEHGRAVLAEIKAKNALVVAITNESWGERMTPLMRRAFAEYMRRFNLDVSEVDNLGGRPYRNGRYYERKLAELRTAGKVEWSRGYYISDDDRLNAAADAGDEWALTERNFRLRERIKHAVPRDASHAYVTVVKLKSDGEPLTGCDWITPGRMKKTYNGPKVADPVGEEEPEKTVITRSWRRVGLLVAAELPELKAEEEAMEVEAVGVGQVVKQIGDEEHARDERAAITPTAIAHRPDDDPYGLGPSQHANSTNTGEGVDSGGRTSASPSHVTPGSVEHRQERWQRPTDPDSPEYTDVLPEDDEEGGA